MDEATDIRIDIENNKDVKYWSETFGCSEEDLVDSVLKVGDIPRVVNLFLTLNRKTIKQN